MDHLPANTIRVASNLDLAGLDGLCLELSSVRSDRASDSVILDLRELRSATAGGLATLIAGGRGLSQTTLAARISEVLLSERPESVRLQPVDITKLLTRGVAPRGEVFLDADERACCACFSDESSIVRAAHALSAELADAFEAPTGQVRPSIFSILDEVARNVLQHSRAAEGVMAAWFEPERNVVEMAVCDAGIGVRASLRKNHAHEEVTSDEAALKAAIRPQISGDPTSGGLGLFYASQVIAFNGGSLLIRSGSSELTSMGDRHSLRENLPQLAGTLVALRARRDRAFDYDAPRRAMIEPAGITLSA